MRTVKPMAFERTKAQNAVIQNRGGGLLVSAAAGSGKTSVLVERLLERILTEGRRIDEFLIITFTKAAAEELRTRIARALAQKRKDDPNNRHLQRQAMLLYQTQISTIHSLCTAILREWGHLIDIPTDFSLCEEEDAIILMNQSLQEVLEERYESITEDSDFAKLLDVLSAGRDDSRLVEITLDVYGRMQSHPDPKHWMQEQAEAFSLSSVSEAGETVWGQLLLSDTEQVAGYWVCELSHTISLAEEEESLHAYVDSLMATYEALQELQTATKLGWDATAVAVAVPFPRLKAVRNCPNPQLQDYIKRIRSNCKETMEDLQKRFSSSSEELLEDMSVLYPAVMGLFDLVRDFSERYQMAKKRKAVLDFNDLEHRTVSLLYAEDGKASEIAKEIGSRYAEIMVDEYQDTNQVQNSIFSALSQKGQNLFMVGDVKQSIYRFRLADPTIFLDKYRKFVSYESAQEGENRKILLSQNFRSRPEVLDAVNDLFRNIMSDQLGEMNYTDEEALYPGGNFPLGEGFETEFHVLNFEAMEDESIGRKPGNHELEARHIANEIATLLSAPFMISDDNGGLRPVEPEDIAILLRSPGTVRHHYETALRELEIPWASEGNQSFFETTEVSVILSFLQIIDNPRQDVPLISVLHSPLYGFDAERLAQVRKIQNGDLYTALQAAAEAGLEDCTAFLQELLELRFEARELSCHELIWKLYQRTNALEIFAQMLGGKKREENLLAFYELACRFEKAGHRGLFGFLFHLSKLEASNVSGASGESDYQGVKLLSIHRSKGLEYPVVFLCGLGKRFNYSDIQKPVLFHSKLGLGPRGLDSERMVEFETLPRQAVALQLKREMLAEEMRLLYVAMTRAKEKLIMTHALSYGEGDIKKLIPYISTPVDPNVLSRCSSVGQWMLLAAMARPEGSVLRKVGDAESVMAQNSLGLPWKVRYQKGIPGEKKSIAERILAPQEQEALYTQEELQTLLQWEYPYQRLAAIPAKITATQLSGEQNFEGFFEKEEPLNKHFFEEKTAFHRPRFATEELGLTSAQKGTALHVVMQSIRFDRTDSVDAVQMEISRLVAESFLTEQEADSVDSNKVYAFFHSQLGQELKEAQQVHREFPFSILVSAKRFYPNVPDGEELLLQGVIDCWFETDKGITLVDFKTNQVSAQDAPRKAEQYRTQMEAYTVALEAMSGKPVVRKMLWFLTPNCGVEISVS